MNTVSPAPPRPEQAQVGRTIRGMALVSVLAALLVTLLLEALDQTVVGTALPRIVGELQGFDRYTWVVTAYLLGSTAMIPIVGKLSDQFGRKWFFLVGVAVFLLGSGLSGASRTINQLIVFRAIQGVGAGMGIALVFTVVADIFPPAERARWQGLFSSVYGFSSVVGPLLGGFLTDQGPLLGTLVTESTRWRWIFYVNLPLGLVALGLLLVYLPSNISSRTGSYRGWAAIRRIDFLGAALASAGTIALLLGLTLGGNESYGWASPWVLASLAAAVLLYGGFLVAEQFATEPLLPRELFKNQVFAADAVLSLTQGMVLLSLAIYLPLFMQGVLGQSATNAGAVITPLTLSITAGALGSGFVIARLRRYRAVAVGSAVLTLLGVLLLTRLSPSTSLLAAGLEMVVAGLGVGSFFSLMTLAVQNALPRHQLGLGTGLIRYVGQLGSTIGVAIVGSVVTRSTAADLSQRLPASVIASLGPEGLKYATNPQVLVDPSARAAAVDSVSRLAAQNAVQTATASIPPGPQHDAQVASITQGVAAQALDQAQATLSQVFDALRLSLATGINHGLLAVLAFCFVLLIASIYLKDVPLATHFTHEPGSE